MRRIHVWVFALGWFAMGPAPLGPTMAWAGMPSITLTDVASARLQTISFFLLMLLLSSWAIQAIWNGLRGDFPRLPRLSYPRAMGLMTLWGFLFVLVLTMISGARELLTPGAWKKQGLTYTIDEPTPPPAVRDEPSRLDKLGELRDALWAHAREHQGRFPDDPASSGIPIEKWRIADPSGMHYLYVPGARLGDLDAVVAYEPGVHGASRYVLLSDGAIELMGPRALRAALGRSGSKGQPEAARPRGDR